MKTFFALREANESCPVATKSLETNVKNRQVAIDKFAYGPANPDEPGDFWNKVSDMWHIPVEEAKTMRCGNCAAFNISDKMRACINTGIGDHKEDGDAVIQLADLGYCELLHFKCAGTRTCAIWLTGGPLEKT